MNLCVIHTYLLTYCRSGVLGLSFIRSHLSSERRAVCTQFVNSVSADVSAAAAALSIICSIDLRRQAGNRIVIGLR